MCWNLLLLFFFQCSIIEGSCNEALSLSHSYRIRVICYVFFSPLFILHTAHLWKDRGSSVSGKLIVFHTHTHTPCALVDSCRVGLFFRLINILCLLLGGKRSSSFCCECAREIKIGDSKTLLLEFQVLYFILHHEIFFSLASFLSSMLHTNNILLLLPYNCINHLTR